MSRQKDQSKEKMSTHFYRMVCYIVLALLTFLSLFFFYMLVINATRSNSSIQQGFSFVPGGSFMANLRNVLGNQNLPVLSGIFNSLFVSAVSAICSIYFSAMTAYGIHAYEFKGRNKAFTFILLIMMIPTQVSALGFVRLVNDMGLRDTFWPLILPAIAAPVVVFFMRQYMASNLPIELIEAARVDGGGEFYTFNKIVLPILKPAMAVQAIFTFVGSWNNYFIPALIIDSSNKKTLPILIAQLRSADFLKFDLGQVYMLITIAIMPVVIMYLCLSKFIVRGVALGGVKE
ncbi:carbohydrate ABC transporter permease [Niameybacter massiliensis]|uniref:Carbohydrate ABC transporter permease n=1 Tax=Holtiella tumoricola TaxID=3018743 RepID=A0AA42J052_9FIRM|nr:MULTISPECIES: carbohydrate ABC transporter permease [Lachnospirales]MDA3730891.1 carbohydrate ABC transporter permease [Holtiella tumoricola]